MAQGFFGGTMLKTSDVTFAPETKFAVLMVTSLTDEPIKRSSRLLVTAMSTTRRVGPENSQRYRSQCVKGEVTIRFESRPKTVRVTPLFGDGSKGEPMEMNTSDDGALCLALSHLNTHWCLLETGPE